MGFWFTLIVCAAWINLSYAQSVGQDGSECNNKLEQLIYRQAVDLATVMTDMKTLIMISSQQDKMDDIETRFANIETKMTYYESQMSNVMTEIANIKTEIGNVKTEVANNSQTMMEKIENIMANLTAQTESGNVIIQKYYKINIHQHQEHNKTYIVSLTEKGSKTNSLRVLEVN